MSAFTLEGAASHTPQVTDYSGSQRHRTYKFLTAAVSAVLSGQLWTWEPLEGRDSFTQLCVGPVHSLSPSGSRWMMLNRTESIDKIGTKDCYPYAEELNVCYGRDLAGQCSILQQRRLMTPNQDSAPDHRRARTWNKGLQCSSCNQSICLNPDLAQSVWEPLVADACHRIISLS